MAGARQQQGGEEGSVYLNFTLRDLTQPIIFRMVNANPVELEVEGREISLQPGIQADINELRRQDEALANKVASLEASTGNAVAGLLTEVNELRTQIGMLVESAAPGGGEVERVPGQLSLPQAMDVARINDKNPPVKSEPIIKRPRKGPPFECRVCHKNFLRKDLFMIHQWVHDQSLSCGYCEERFVDLESLKDHLQDEHSGKFVSKRVIHHGI